MKSWESNYNLISELGTGGNANVYRVLRKSDNTQYALKELNRFRTEKKNRFIEESFRLNCVE